MEYTNSPQVNRSAAGARPHQQPALAPPFPLLPTTHVCSRDVETM